jgi:hypothetical protein
MYCIYIEFNKKASNSKNSLDAFFEDDWRISKFYLKGKYQI